MNAPAKTAHLAQPQVELIPLQAIVPSETHVQQERRRAYSIIALEELAASIKDNGILMPILVRPLATGRDDLAKYELVAGERRWRAAGTAGQAHIIARILPLTDAQVLKAQVVENIHREALDPLAEAQGYRELMACGISADAIGDLVGKSRSYVYARTKLLALAPGVQKALTAGELTASQALLFARIPGEKLQEAGLNTLRKWDYQGRGEPLSFRRTAAILQNKAKGIFIPLAAVPFRLDDDSYHAFGPKVGKNQAQEVIALPTCLACPRRSGNDAELLAALEDPDVCTDKTCHDVKAKQALEQRRRAVEARGETVLRGDEAAALLPSDFGTRGYIDLDEPCDADEYTEPKPKQDKDEPEEAFDRRMQDWEERSYDYKPRSYRQLLGADVAKLAVKVVEDPKRRRLRELAPDKAVVALLKEKGIAERLQRDTRKPTKPDAPKDPEAAKRQAEKEARAQAKAALEKEIATDVRGRLLKAVHDKWKGPLDRDELELVVHHVQEEFGFPDSLEILYPGTLKPGTMNQRDLGRFLLMHAVCTYLDSYSEDERPLRALCKRLKIDPRGVEKEMRQARAPKASVPEPKAAKKSKRK